MTDEELIANLRDSKGWPNLGNAAADRIEQLVKGRDEVERRRVRWMNKADDAEAKLAKAVEALQFYAKEEWPQYYPCGVLYAAGNDTPEFKTHLDYGNKARATLAELERTE